MKRFAAFASGVSVGLLVAAVFPTVIILTLSIQQWCLGEERLDREDIGFLVVCFAVPAVALVLLGAATQSMAGSSSLWPLCVVGLASLPVTLAIERYLTLHYLLKSAGLFLFVFGLLNAGGAAVTACGVINKRVTNR